MKVDGNIKLPELIRSTLLLSKKDIGLKRYIAKSVRFWNSVTLKMGIAFDFWLQLANHKPQRSDHDIVCKANNGT